MQVVLEEEDPLVTLKELIAHLPPDLQQEVRGFVVERLMYLFRY